MRFAVLLDVLVLVLALAACGSTKTDPPANVDTGGNHVLQGGLLGKSGSDLEEGIVRLTVHGSLTQGLRGVVDTVEAVGQVQFRSSPRPISLAGTYDSDGKLVVTGGDYTFTGTTSAGGVIAGDFLYDGLEPPPVPAGSFVLVSQGTDVYCGTLSDTSPLVLAGSPGLVEGLFLLNGAVARYGGTRQDRAFSATGDGELSLTGTADGTVTSGTYTLATQTGTFSGQTAACLTP